MERHPYLDVEGPIPIAHRGGASEGPENTLSAFQNAVDLGYRYIETDVHCTADGVLVAFHDDRLDRMTDRQGLISELSWSEVALAKVAGTEKIPRLDELLVTFPEVYLNIDPKADRAVAPLISALRDHNALPRVCVGSFSDARLARLHAEFGAEVCLSAGPREIIRLRLASFGLPLRRFRARCAQVPRRQGPIPITDRRFLECCHGLGLAVHVWTIDEPEVMHELLDLGVDGIMTDVPDVLLRAFADRNLDVP